MFVITVVPLRRGITVDTLSYFSTEHYVEGTMVTIPIRNTQTLGLVTSAEAVSAAKTALRAATFSLRKLPPQSDPAVLSRAYVQTAADLSRQYATSMGAILYNLLAPEIRAGDIKLPHTHHITHSAPSAPQILEASREERYRAYRSLVRETFAHSGSVLLVVPASIDAEKIHEALSNGIEDRIVMLTSTLTKTELKKAYAALEDFSKTKLIIATPSHALVERHDITVVVLEHARSSYYKELTRPYIDYRDALKVHARHTGRRLLFGDLLLRAEEGDLRRNDIYSTLGEAAKRIELPGKLEIIDMTKKDDTDAAFAIFSDTVIQAINETRKKKGRVFLFAARRGLAPIVTCMDCRYIFRSKESGAPYSLIRTHKNGVEERWFVCGASGERLRAVDTCPECGSWRLKERGIGIQQVYDEVHKVFPNTPTVLFDHITAKTYKRALFLHDTFYKTKGAILLGTQMTLPYLTKSVDLSVVVNMDALLATPTWRLEEENLALLLRLREETTGAVYIQTRTPETSILAHAKHGTVEHFYTEELALRKTFNYPPYATFIHLTWQGAPEIVKKMETDITTLLKKFNISTYQNPTSPANAPIMYGLIRIPSSEWPHGELVNILRSLPPTIRVVINPDKIV